ncbi:Uncharacterized SAM-binding protein YcdF, DUF218 family [Lachnospiraceae bacterium]|nr:Uncharacterized SAM-binding protein YcdF, DUF218 family [Lachnospiraceae bacterium]
MREKVLPVIFILIGLICFLLFTNVIYWGILNIGNVTGIIISLILILYGFFMKQINQTILKLWSVSGGKIFLIIVSAVAATILVLAIVTTTCIVKGCYERFEKNAVLIVLGCQVRGESPSLMMVERLTVAKDYLETYPDTVCIVSGGTGEGEDISEAECMRRWLISKGISKNRILMEDKSTSTDENIRFSKQIMDDNDLGSSISIATNEFHEYRAGKIADKYGLKHGAVSAKTAWWLLPTYYVREMYGILAEYILN